LAATFFFGAIDFIRVQVLGRSYTWWNWPAFQEHCEHVLASSRVSQQAAVRKRQSWLLSAKAAAVADIVDPLLMTHLGRGAKKHGAMQQGAFDGHFAEFLERHFLGHVFDVMSL
jgi:hypothetical protein